MSYSDLNSYQDRIQELDLDGKEISPTVRGSRHYNVTIDVGADPIRTRCNSGGRYGCELENAIQSYAETVAEQNSTTTRNDQTSSICAGNSLMLITVPLATTTTTDCEHTTISGANTEKIV